MKKQNQFRFACIIAKSITILNTKKKASDKDSSKSYRASSEMKSWLHILKESYKMAVGRKQKSDFGQFQSYIN